MADQIMKLLTEHATEKDGKLIFKDTINDLVMNEPKRPKNPFFLFKEENKDAIKKQMGSNSDYSGQGSFTSAASEIWKNMSLEEKLPYEERYSRMKENYHNQKRIYDNTFGKLNINLNVEKPKKKRGRPRKSPVTEESVQTNEDYVSLVIDGVSYELEVATNIIWNETREDTVGIKVGPKSYEFYWM